MAGIGFELKRLFARKGMIATVRAYSYAAIVCAGPMLLGYSLLLLSGIIVDHAGASRHDRELMVSMITHTLLASLTVTSLFSMLTTRFCADMIYEQKYKKLMPSFYGSLTLMLILGGIAYGVFLHFSGVRLVYRVLCWVFFMILIVTWTQMNYLTMLKDFRSIVLCFAVAVAVALGLGCVMIFLLHQEPVLSMMISICVGYGVMMVWFFAIIYKYLPEGVGTSMRFLEWFDRTPELGFVGFFITLGMFGHLLIMWWFSDLRVQVEGLFYGAPGYDVPAIIAFFSILITTVNFTTSVETRFYPRYQEYFSLFNDGGSIENIRESEKTMIHVLCDEMGYLAIKQIFSTLLFIIIGTIVIPQLPLGFDSRMLQTFRCLCVGYAFYAIGNSLMLISQYFADLRGAFISSFLFALLTNGLTLLFTLTIKGFYGLGFILGSAAFAIAAAIRLCWFLRKLKFHVLSRQPLFALSHAGVFTWLADFFERRAATPAKEKQPEPVK